MFQQGIKESSVLIFALTAVLLLAGCQGGSGGDAGAVGENKDPIDTLIDLAPGTYATSRRVEIHFSANLAETTFECRLDADAFGACSSPKIYNNLSEREYRFEVRAVSKDDIADPTPAVISWIVDVTYPATLITDGPPPDESPSLVIFEFTSDDPAATFECSIDGGTESDFSVCTSPHQRSGISTGQHVFHVRAVDPAGLKDQTPETYAFGATDAVPPNTTITSKPADPTNALQASFSFTANEYGSLFECALDTGSFVDCISPYTFGTGPGQHTFKVRAIDPSENVDPSPAEYGWFIDTQAPQTNIDSTPNQPSNQSSATFTFSATDNHPPATFECKLGQGPFETCLSGVTYDGLDNEQYRFEVRATDAAGNVDDSPAVFTWSVDTLAPTVNIISAPSDPNASSQGTFEFEANQAGSSFECKFEGTAYAPCSSPHDVSRPAGQQTFYVRAIDTAGNLSNEDSYSYFIDMQPPETELLTAPEAETTQISAQFTFSGTDNHSPVTFECKLDNGSYATCVSGIQYGNLTDDVHTFQVRAKDTVGNVDGSPAVYSWKIDSTAPETTILGSPVSPTYETGATFNYQASGEEPGDAVQFFCKLNDEPFSVCPAGGISYSGLPAATHRFEVYAVDEMHLSDPTPAVHEWQVLIGWQQVSSFQSHSCGITTYNELRCWGRNNYGQLGSGDDETIPERRYPVQEATHRQDWSFVSAGGTHTCAIRDVDTNGGWLYCWGQNSAGQLGNGFTYDLAESPNQVQGQSGGPTNDWLKVSAGLSHTCGIRNGGKLYCWGQNDSGELGLGDVSQGTDYNRPQRVGAATDWLDIDCGASFSCGIRSQSGVRNMYCWGSNQSGRLGVGANPQITTRLSSPEHVSGHNNWRNVSVGFLHACATKQNGELYCWGGGNDYRLGQGDLNQNDYFSPIQVVSDSSNWSLVVAGEQHSCALTTDNQRFCWGGNEYGKLGLGDQTDRSTPDSIAENAEWSVLAAGTYHSCGIQPADNTLWCFGANFYGQLGNRDPKVYSEPLHVATQLQDADTLSTGHYQSYAIKDGQLFGAGLNHLGQLGDETLRSRKLFSQIGSDLWKQVRGGMVHTCGLKNNNSLWCWGSNMDGGLGRPGGDITTTTPLPVGSDTWFKVDSGSRHGCAIKNNDARELYCWGYNYNKQLGINCNGVDDCRTIFEPTLSNTPNGWEELYLGGEHSCALNADKELNCWGANWEGQCGLDRDDATVDTAQRLGPMTWEKACSGMTHSCGIQTDGSLYCWGSNILAQLGVGGRNNLPVPTCTANSNPEYCKAPIRIGSANWSDIDCNGAMTCGIQTDGTLWCWGLMPQADSSTAEYVQQPTQVGSANDWILVVAGWMHQCGLKYDAGEKNIYCWNYDVNGQVGAGTAWQELPIKVE